jgi:hypothetical protein
MQKGQDNSMTKRTIQFNDQKDNTIQWQKGQYNSMTKRTIQFNDNKDNTIQW